MAGAWNKELCEKSVSPKALGGGNGSSNWGGPGAAEGTGFAFCLAAPSAWCNIPQGIGEVAVRQGPHAPGEGDSHLLKSYYVLGPWLGPFVSVISAIPNNCSQLSIYYPSGSNEQTKIKKLS